MESLQSVKDLAFPKAVLVPVTDEAVEAVDQTCLPNHMIGILKFPFKLGRESRVGQMEGEQVVMERKKATKALANNDFYVIDFGKRLQISREHFSIENDNGRYSLVDRESACGTSVNSQQIGGYDKGGTLDVKHGDTIKLGTDESKYLFKFLILN